MVIRHEAFQVVDKVDAGASGMAVDEVKQALKVGLDGHGLQSIPRRLAAARSVLINPSIATRRFPSWV